jgi:hypothetical protein
MEFRQFWEPNSTVVSVSGSLYQVSGTSRQIWRCNEQGIFTDVSGNIEPLISESLPSIHRVNREE